MAELNVLYACDDNYAPYTGVSITSLLENNKDIEQITIYLAEMGFSDDNKEKVKETVKKYGRRLVFVDTQKAQRQIERYQCQGWNGSIATWLRFFVLEQLPQDMNRILWLDSDTIVCSNLLELCDHDFQNHPIACVYDSLCYYERFRLGHSYADPYFNAGVIYFNLEYWRKNNVLDAMFQHLQSNIKYYSLNDQDLLNDYFHGQIQPLPQRYNCQGTHLAYSAMQYLSVYPWEETAYYSRSEIEKTVSDPAIIHFFRFLGDYPWHQGHNYHPARDLYEGWKTHSLWYENAGTPARRSVLFAAEKILFLILPKRVFLKLFSFITNRNLPKHPQQIS